jgi:hypothetical protein
MKLKKTLMRFFLFAVVVLFACGGDDPEPGEEVVVERWEDPVDIGKEYSVGEVKVGDTVLLSTGEEHVVGKYDFFEEKHGVEFLSIPISKPDPHGSGGSLIEWVPKRVVPDGPPIVSLTVYEFVPDSEGGTYVTKQVTGESNLQDDVWLQPHIKVDRILDYNLPIYIEFQSQEKEELGGEVQRIRFLTVVLKGETFARPVHVDDWSYNFGDRSTHVRTSVSILSHTEMESIDLPVYLDIEHRNASLEDRVLLEGHIFRPYRIASSSFLMGEAEVERNW